jgi:hypothetical protein
MSAVETLALVQLSSLLASCLLTLAAVWTAGRLAPIVLGKGFKPASVREYFFKDDGDMSQSGYVMIMLSAAVLLTMLIALALMARAFGWQFAG